jgi:hypothetical protein
LQRSRCTAQQRHSRNEQECHAKDLDHRILD